MDLAVAALGLPVSSDLFGIHDAGGGKARRRARRLDGPAAAVALPSVSSRRIRPGPLERTRARCMKKELSMEVRLLLAFVLMGLVLFGTQYFFKPPASACRKAGAARRPRSEYAVRDVQLQAPAIPSQPLASKPRRCRARFKRIRKRRVTVDTDLYHVVFSNRGAVVRSWILKDYQGSHGQAARTGESEGARKAFPRRSRWLQGSDAGDRSEQRAVSSRPRRTTD